MKFAIVFKLLYYLSLVFHPNEGYIYKRIGKRMKSATIEQHDVEKDIITYDDFVKFAKFCISQRKPFYPKVYVQYLPVIFGKVNNGNYHIKEKAQLSKGSKYENNFHHFHSDHSNPEDITDFIIKSHKRPFRYRNKIPKQSLITLKVSDGGYKIPSGMTSTSSSTISSTTDIKTENDEQVVDNSNLKYSISNEGEEMSDNILTFSEEKDHKKSESNTLEGPTTIKIDFVKSNYQKDDILVDNNDIDINTKMSTTAEMEPISTTLNSRMADTETLEVHDKNFQIMTNQSDHTTALSDTAVDDITVLENGLQSDSTAIPTDRYNYQGSYSSINLNKHDPTIPKNFKKITYATDVMPSLDDLF